MRTNQIDEFRDKFFSNMIEEAKKQEEAKRMIQLKCTHHYGLILESYPNSYQQRACTKCGHSDVRKLEVWEGTKNCVIS